MRRGPRSRIGVDTPEPAADTDERLDGHGGERSAAHEPRRQNPEQRIGPIEHELTLHLTRAHELAERAKRANGNAQYEIDCAREIADELIDRVTSATRRRNDY